MKQKKRRCNNRKHGCTISEISEIIKLSESDVKNCLYGAIRKMRSHLKKNNIKFENLI